MGPSSCGWQDQTRDLLVTEAREADPPLREKGPREPETAGHPRTSDESGYPPVG